MTPAFILSILPSPLPLRLRMNHWTYLPAKFLRTPISDETTQILDLLLRSGISIDESASSADAELASSALLWAIKRGNQRLVEILVRRRSNLFGVHLELPADTDLHPPDWNKRDVLDINLYWDDMNTERRGFLIDPQHEDGLPQHKRLDANVGGNGKWLLDVEPYRSRAGHGGVPSGVEPETLHLRAAVVEHGCDKHVVMALLDAWTVKIDFADRAIWQWIHRIKKSSQEREDDVGGIFEVGAWQAAYWAFTNEEVEIWPHWALVKRWVSGGDKWLEVRGEAYLDWRKGNRGEWLEERMKLAERFVRARRDDQVDFDATPKFRIGREPLFPWDKRIHL